jgi:hypothetical protein
VPISSAQSNNVLVTGTLSVVWSGSRYPMSKHQDGEWARWEWPTLATRP